MTGTSRGKIKRWIWRILVALCMLVLAVSLILMGWELYQQKQSADVYAALSDDVLLPAGLDVEAPVVDVPTPFTVNWDALAGTETVAWFLMDDISYPILQHDDDSYYLNHLPNGNRGSGGSLFLAAANDRSFADRNSVVYGHNMRNGTMFGKLRRYVSSAYADHTFALYFPDGTKHTYQFFSVATVLADSRAYTFSFGSDASFLDWQQWMLDQSEVDCRQTPDADGTFVTLSTCKAHGSNERRVICGKEVAVEQVQEPAGWLAE